MTQNNSPENQFGYKTVEAKEKSALVQQVFSSVASKYDIMNDLMSLGLHRCWKDSFVNSLPMTPESKVLDVAGGTGDIALRIHKRYGAVATILDRNFAMVSQGQDKAINQGILDLKWVCGDAETLPFPDESFDFYTISFGIRNVTHRQQALKEAWRVLKPGGIFACLEFSHAAHPRLEKLMRAYQFSVIPFLGSLVANDRDSYQYLVESIDRFPDAKAFGCEIIQAGFTLASIRSLGGGGVASHVGVKKNS